jgi:hypothetical protein
MDVRAERQDLREIAVIDLDDKERKELKDAGYKCARRLLEAQRGKCTELLIIQSRMAQSIRTYRSR